MTSLMSLPRATQFTIGALLAALLGWGILIFSTAAHDDDAELWAQQRGDLEEQVARLGQDGEQLQARVAELQGALEQERAAAGDLASVRGRIDGRVIVLPWSSGGRRSAANGVPRRVPGRYQHFAGSRGGQARQ